MSPVGLLEGQSVPAVTLSSMMKRKIEKQPVSGSVVLAEVPVTAESVHLSPVGLLEGHSVLAVTLSSMMKRKIEDTQSVTRQEIHTLWNVDGSSTTTYSDLTLSKPVALSIAACDDVKYSSDSS